VPDDPDRHLLEVNERIARDHEASARARLAAEARPPRGAGLRRVVGRARTVCPRRPSSARFTGRMSRPSNAMPVALLAAGAGTVGFLAGLYLLTLVIGDGTSTSGPLAGVILGASVAELAFAYGARTGSRWASRRATRAIGTAVALALLGFGGWIGLSAPVRESDRTAGQPVVTPIVPAQSESTMRSRAMAHVSLDTNVSVT
jgi:hypothetical protein